MTVLPLPTFLNPTCPFRTVLHRTDSVLDSQTCTNLRNVSSNLHKTAEFVIGPGARPFVVCVHMKSDFWVLEAPCVSCLPSSAHLLRHPYVSFDPGSEAVRSAPNHVHRPTPQPVPAHFTTLGGIPQSAGVSPLTLVQDEHTLPIGAGTFETIFYEQPPVAAQAATTTGAAEHLSATCSRIPPFYVRTCNFTCQHYNRDRHYVCTSQRTCKRHRMRKRH